MEKNNNLVESTTINGTISITDGTSTTCMINLYPQRTLISSQFIKKESGNFIEMIYKETFNNFGTTVTYTNYYPQETMVKEIYGVKDGKLELVNVIKGKEVPGYYIPATVVWEE